ncbi:hypothetical protein HK101_000989 [Irineochytrium annulatum]|nr:hypothetical protein HK101_000989 [Irineochytrium annulatum]
MQPRYPNHNIFPSISPFFRVARDDSVAFNIILGYSRIWIASKGSCVQGPCVRRTKICSGGLNNRQQAMTSLSPFMAVAVVLTLLLGVLPVHVRSQSFDAAVAAAFNSLPACSKTCASQAGITAENICQKDEMSDAISSCSLNACGHDDFGAMSSITANIFGLCTGLDSPPKPVTPPTPATPPTTWTPPTPWTPPAPVTSWTPPTPSAPPTPLAPPTPVVLPTPLVAPTPPSGAPATPSLASPTPLAPQPAESDPSSGVANSAHPSSTPVVAPKTFTSSNRASPTPRTSHPAASDPTDTTSSSSSSYSSSSPSFFSSMPPLFMVVLVIFALVFLCVIFGIIYKHFIAKPRGEKMGPMIVPPKGVMLYTTGGAARNPSRPRSSTTTTAEPRRQPTNEFTYPTSEYTYPQYPQAAAGHQQGQWYAGGASSGSGTYHSRTSEPTPPSSMRAGEPVPPYPAFHS